MLSAPNAAAEADVDMAGCLAAALRRPRALRLHHRTELWETRIAVPPTYRGQLPDGTATNRDYHSRRSKVVGHLPG